MAAADTKDVRDARSALAGVQVLVVEDVWHVAKALKSALGELGMIVAGPAANISDAQRIATETQPDIAVVDVNLKGELAYDLIDWMHDRGTQVVVITGYAVLPRSTEKAAAVLQKPFSGAELRTTLLQVVEDGGIRSKAR